MDKVKDKRNHSTTNIVKPTGGVFGDVEAEKDRKSALKAFKKRFFSSDTSTNVASMGNKVHESSVKHHNLEDSKTSKQCVSGNVPSKANLFPDGQSSVEIMDDQSQTTNKIKRRKTKSERNRSRAHLSNHKQEKVEEKVSKIQEKANFQKNVKKLDKEKKKDPDVEILEDYSKITTRRLTLDTGLGLFNRRKTSQTVTKDVKYLKLKDLEIEVLPEAKKRSPKFDARELHNSLSQETQHSQDWSSQNRLEITPPSSQRNISLKSGCSSRIMMDVDHISLSSQSLPTSPDLEALAAVPITMQDVQEKFPGRDLLKETKAELKKIYQMRNPDHNSELDFRTPLSKLQPSRGLSSESVKRNLAEHYQPVSACVSRSKAPNSSSSIHARPSSILAHKQAVEAMHVQYHNRLQQDRAVPLQHAQQPQHRYQQDLAPRDTGVAPKSHHNEQLAQFRTSNTSAQLADISLETITDAKCLLEYNEKAAEVAEAARIDAMDFTLAPTNIEEQGMFYRETENQNPAHRDFDQMYRHRRSASEGTANQRVIAQYLPQNGDFVHRTIEQPWVDSGPTQPRAQYQMLGGGDFLNLVDHDHGYHHHQGQDRMDITYQQMPPRSLAHHQQQPMPTPRSLTHQHQQQQSHRQSPRHNSPTWIAPMANKPSIFINEDTPSPPHFYPRKMF